MPRKSKDPEPRVSPDSTAVIAAAAATAAAPARSTRTSRTKTTSATTTGVTRKRATTVARNNTVTQAVEPTLDRDEVARLAYSYWEARGFQGGTPEEDWRRAELEIRNRQAEARNS